MSVFFDQENILVNSNGHPMLADFGISRFVSMNGEPTEVSYEGSVRWMAIELIDELMSGSGRLVHTKESDVWGFGATVYVSLPFYILYRLHR